MRGFGDLDGEKLRALLEETDRAGRFEIDALGRARKLDRDARAPRKEKPEGGPAPAPHAARPQTGRVSLSPSSSASRRCGGSIGASSSSRSASPGGEGDDADADRALAAAAGRSLRVAGDVEVLPAEQEAADGRDERSAGGPPAPPPPPGELG